MGGPITNLDGGLNARVYDELSAGDQIMAWSGVCSATGAPVMELAPAAGAFWKMARVGNGRKILDRKDFRIIQLASGRL